MLIVKSSRMDEKLLLGIFFHENSPLAPLEWNFDVLFSSPCLDESIGILLVKLGRTVEKSFKGVFLSKVSGCSPVMKFGKFFIFLCVSASQAISISVLLVRIG
jgi:hypothetical protein